MYYPARILKVAESKADLVRQKGTSKRTRVPPLKYLHQESDDTASCSSESETPCSTPETNNVMGTTEETLAEKMKKVENMLQKTAVHKTQLQPIVALKRIESGISKFPEEKFEEIAFQNDLTPPLQETRDASSFELEFLRKENLFLRDECSKKDKQLQETITKLNETICRLEAAAMKVNEGASNLSTQGAHHTDANHKGNISVPLNGKVTLANGVTVCQKNLRIISSMSKTPSIFVGDLAELVFDKLTLMTNTIYRRNKDKGKLCPQKIEAIRCEFERLLFQDMAYDKPEVVKHLRKMNHYINNRSGWLLAESRRHDQVKNIPMTIASSTSSNSTVRTTTNSASATSVPTSSTTLTPPPNTLKASTSPKVTSSNIMKKKIILLSKVPELEPTTSRCHEVAVLKPQSEVLGHSREPESQGERESSNDVKAVFQPWIHAS